MKNDLKNLEVAIKSAKFASRVEFSSEQIGLLLSSFQDDLNDYVDLVGKDSKNENFVFRNSESDNSRQITLLIGKNTIQLAWGHEYDESKAKLILSKVADISSQSVNNFQKVLQFFDTEFLFDFKTKKNHYKIISDIVYANSPLAILKNIGRRNLTNDIHYSIELNDSCVLVVSIIGGHSEQDIKSDSLDERTLRVRFSIGKTKELLRPELKTIVLNHFDFVKELIEKKLFEQIVTPISKET